ncbi:hypothetical protein Y1Q_0010693 [Alligator mississippiensis]|uniref:Uncharacterized protein n=1 Tax=Alligator mississippiensis TaxID=8496 RepID=A0A151M6F2_ALLMI|nr:hypothetical protein Y1Q_0010693 [Alligator mississippiensis]
MGGSFTWNQNLTRVSFSNSLTRGLDGWQQLVQAVPEITPGLKRGSLVVKSLSTTQPHPSMKLWLIPAWRLGFFQTHRNSCRLMG